MIDEILRAHPLISDQVNQNQVRVILQELDALVGSGVPGAVVEFGCYTGTTSLFIRRLLNKLGDDREFHVYDSFAGLPPKSHQDDSPAGEQFRAGELLATKKQFILNFKKAGLALPVIHKGWFSDFTSIEVPSEIALAFLDGDFYDSIKDSLNLVLPNMTAGGTIIIDDYSNEALPGAAKAVHEVFSPDKIRVISNLGVIRL